MLRGNVLFLYWRVLSVGVLITRSPDFWKLSVAGGNSQKMDDRQGPLVVTLLFNNCSNMYSSPGHMPCILDPTYGSSASKGIHMD